MCPGCGSESVREHMCKGVCGCMQMCVQGCECVEKCMCVCIQGFGG